MIRQLGISGGTGQVSVGRTRIYSRQSNERQQRQQSLPAMPWQLQSRKEVPDESRARIRLDWLGAGAAAVGAGGAGDMDVESIGLRHAKRTDANHASIRDGLRARGWIVEDLSGAGDGVPDLAVSVMRTAPCGWVHFIEIKDGAKPLSAQKLTAAQERWHRMAWQMTSRVTSLEEAVEVMEWASKRYEQFKA